MNPLWGEDLRQEARRRMVWKNGVRGQIVDPDIDGLLSAALCHEFLGWPVVGFYDTHTLWVSSELSLPLDLSTIAWVDLDMTWPGTQSISQHALPSGPVSNTPPDCWTSTVNPSVIHRVHTADDYKRKYPFGTFQWLWWVLDIDTDVARLETPVGTGLAWMPDGGFVSVARYEQNVRTWGSKIMPGSLLSPLTSRDSTAEEISRFAERAVKAAQKHLVTDHNRSGWTRTHQWEKNLPENARRSPVEKEYFLRDVQGLLDRITTFYGWRPVSLPSQFRDFHGVHHRSRLLGDQRRGLAGWVPPDWPGAAAQGRIVSAARTLGWAGAWTTPAPPEGSGWAGLDVALGRVSCTSTLVAD